MKRLVTIAMLAGFAAVAATPALAETRSRSG